MTLISYVTACNGLLIQHAACQEQDGGNLGPDCIVSKDKGFREPRCYILSLKTAGEGLGAAEVRTWRTEGLTGGIFWIDHSHIS